MRELKGIKVTETIDCIIQKYLYNNDITHITVQIKKIGFERSRRERPGVS